MLSFRFALYFDVQTWKGAGSPALPEKKLKQRIKFNNETTHSPPQQQYRQQSGAKGGVTGPKREKLKKKECEQRVRSSCLFHRFLLRSEIGPAQSFLR